MNKLLLHPAAKPLVFGLSLLPFALLLWGAVANTLGANPAEALIRGTGDWVLRFLCITLAVTPLRESFKLPVPGRVPEPRAVQRARETLNKAPHCVWVCGNSTGGIFLTALEGFCSGLAAFARLAKASRPVGCRFAGLLPAFCRPGRSAQDAVPTLSSRRTR